MRKFKRANLNSSREHHALNRKQRNRKQRTFRTMKIFKCLMVLIHLGILMNLWFMFRFEAGFPDEMKDGSLQLQLQVPPTLQPQQQQQEEQSRGVDHNGFERRASQQMIQQQSDAKVIRNPIVNRWSQQPLSNQTEIQEKTKQHIQKQRTTSPGFNQSASLPSLSFPPLPSSLDYLGILIDAGRHYFPMRWLYQHLRYLHNLGYNYIHFRLTDDQNFILNLTIPNDGNRITRTSLAFAARREQEEDNLRDTNIPTNNEGNSSNGGSRSVYYQPGELSKFVKFAKDKYNITIIPEVNVPGHAGAWGANMAFPDVVVSCPEFACSNSYGVPLNLTHPDLPRILKHVLTQVVEIFDHPPFLHLGGDELHLSRPCLKEAGIVNESSWLTENVALFEEKILQPIVEDLGYGPHQIMRWENKNKQQKPEAEHHRFGGITHYWESTPSPQNNEDGDTIPYIVSTGLYLDVTWYKRIYGYGDFEAAQQLVSDTTMQSNPPLAIVVGAFELGMEFWENRNVLGRLLAIRMGVASASQTSLEVIPRTQQEFRMQYTAKCKSIFHSSKFNSTCQNVGMPFLTTTKYTVKWRQVWKEWKSGLCE